MRELETLEVVTPTRLFDDRLSLEFEGIQIEMEDRGPGVTEEDRSYTRRTLAERAFMGLRGPGGL